MGMVEAHGLTAPANPKLFFKLASALREESFPGIAWRLFTGQMLPGAVRMARLRLRLLLWGLGAALAAYFLLPQAGQLGQAIDALNSVSWAWLSLALASSLLIFPMAAWAQMGAVESPLAFRQTAVVQVAATFISQLTPQGIGGMGLNERYLEKQGIDRPTAVAAVTLNMAAGAIVHMLALSLVAMVVGSIGLGGFHIPLGWPALVTIVVLSALIGLTIKLPWVQRRVVEPAIRGVRSVALVLRNPARAVALFGGSAGVTASFALTLVVSVHAFGAHASVMQIVAVYLGAAVVGATMPTPGGLGGFEAALVAGLTALDIAVGPAVAAVLTFRLLTFWLPIVPGFLAFRWLQRRQAV